MGWGVRSAYRISNPNGDGIIRSLRRLTLPLALPLLLPLAFKQPSAPQRAVQFIIHVTLLGRSSLWLKCSAQRFETCTAQDMAAWKRYNRRRLIQTYRALATHVNELAAMRLSATCRARHRRHGALTSVSVHGTVLSTMRKIGKI